MENIIIRQMQTDEIEMVHKIGKRAFTGLESLWVPKPKQALVAVKDGKIAGAILYKFIKAGGRKIGYVDYAFVDRDYHNKGIGNVLYKGAAEYLWEQGCDALTALVKDDNVGSWGLFEKNGFTRTSFVNLAKQFGFLGALKQYFTTPFCFAIGMDYYVATKNQENVVSTPNSIKQLLAFFLINALLFSVTSLRGLKYDITILVVYLMLLLLTTTTEFIGTRCSSERHWKFRVTSGGALTCVFVNIGSLFPMIGNWYPERYEKTKAFRKAMGMTALVSWIALLILTAFLVFSRSQGMIASVTKQVGVYLLIYRMIPIYPFESFGSKRVYDWNKGIYVVMALATLVVIICSSI